MSKPVLVIEVFESGEAGSGQFLAKVKQFEGVSGEGKSTLKAAAKALGALRDLAIKRGVDEVVSEQQQLELDGKRKKKAEADA